MSIPHIEDGQPVPGPGIYRMSMAHYHSQACCPGPSISSSGLRTIWSQSPFHFWATSELNPDRLPEKDESPALALGKGAHALMLGEENFDEMFAYLPDDAPRKPTAQQVKAYDDGRATDVGKASVEFWREFDERTAGKTILSHDMVEKIRRMSESLQSNPAAVQALTGSLTEVSLIWQDDVTGVWLKSRIDVLPDQGADYADLKTWAPRSKNVKRAIHNAISEHEYPMQLALGQMGARAFGMDAEEALLVMLMSVEPYCCSIVRMDEEVMFYARRKLRAVIGTFARCLETGYWPQPIEGVLEYRMPPSELHRLGEMELAGELPHAD
jgi:hypothetical protein